MSLQRALFLLIGAALLAGLIPAGIVLDRRLSANIVETAREDLALAPDLMADRESMTANMMAMHAKELAGTPGLAEALAASDRSRALRLVEAAQPAPGETPFLIGGGGEIWSGFAAAPALAEHMAGNAVTIIHDDNGLYRVALAPVMHRGNRVGIVGVAARVDASTAGELAGLTRSDVVVMAAPGVLAASTAEETVTAAVVDSAAAWLGEDVVHQLSLVGGRQFLVAVTSLGEGASVAFLRDLDTELALLPELRRTAGLAIVAALVVALVLGGMLATVIARPVRALAHAADRVAAGDFEAPLERSAIREVNRVGRTFQHMRRALAARLEDLEAANRELAERQRRLSALQAELIQRDRLAASGRLVAELAHEIRNPVANVRNCLEVIRRRLSDDDQTGREFADLAIDELLRMHELAERMLDLNRPRDPSATTCDVAAVTSEVATLVRAGTAKQHLELVLTVEEQGHTAIPPDALKQVLLNVIHNAREACDDAGTIELSVKTHDSIVAIEVLDDGPGFGPDILPKVFDPFVTTKAEVQGVGLGLFVAEGIVRRYGGRMRAANRTDGRGARMTIELPLEGAASVERAAPGVMPETQG